MFCTQQFSVKVEHKKEKHLKVFILVTTGKVKDEIEVQTRLLRGQRYTRI